MSKNIENFLSSAHSMPSTADVFNPWRDYDRLNDIDKDAPSHRFDHLQRYMEERSASAKILLIAEAPGYNGCKFSGLPMTSERALLKSNAQLVEDQIYFRGPKYRTSKVNLHSGKSNAEGSIEPTATIVWDTMMQHYDSHEFVLWNAFAFHPHDPDDMLTNRTPTPDEIERSSETLKLFLAAFPGKPVVAVGRKSEGALTQLGVAFHAVRHPANGGATKFRAGITALMKSGKK